MTSLGRVVMGWFGILFRIGLSGDLVWAGIKIWLIFRFGRAGSGMAGLG